MWLGACLWLLAAGPAAALGSGRPGATPSLATVLNPNGTLRAGAQGSFDARGFVLHTGPDGRPSFRPASPTGTGDERWLNNFRLPGTDGVVTEIVAAGSTVYIAGTFARVGGIRASCVAAWDGTQWRALGAGLSGGVNALCVSGTDLYAASYVTIAGGAIVSAVSKWNGSTWTQLGGNATSNSGQTPTIYSLVMAGTTLYAGGDFANMGPVAASNVARWDGTAWSALGTGTANGTNYRVLTLAAMGNEVYAGGLFTMAGGSAANYLARWNGTAWSAVGTGTNGVNAAVQCLLTAGTDLYVGGIFSQAGGVAANAIAKWNGTTWSSLGTGTANGVGTAGGGVYSIVVDGSTVYVGGGFTFIGGNRSAYGVARWDGSTWNVMGTARNPGITANDFFVYGYAMALVGGSLYLGGTFVEAGDVAAKHIARWDGTAWNVVGSNANGADDAVYAVAVAGSTVYVGGRFTSVGSVPANQIAKWDGTRWSALTTTVSGITYNGVSTGNGVGSIASVLALAVSGNVLYAAGYFSYAGGVAAKNIARWDGTGWSALGTGITNPTTTTLPAYVYALAVSGTTVYAGGDFGLAGGVVANRVARWNGTTWSALGTGASAPVYALALAGASVYAGGTFTTIGGAAASYVARWDGTAWNAVGTGTNSAVYALVASGTDLYAGGSFTTAGGVAASYVARWNGSTWSGLGPGGDSGGTVRTIALQGPTIYAGGRFTRIGGIAARNAARWDGTAWSTMGTGLNAEVRALGAFTTTQVAAGGLFTAVYDESRLLYNFGVYDEAAPLATQPAATDLDLTLHPNPTASRATLTYRLPAAATVSAEVLDALGRRVATLATDALQAAGPHTLLVPPLAPGVYTVLLHYTGRLASRQLVVN